MEPPVISMPMWWIIAVISVIVFLVFSITLMPNRRYKIQVSSSPVAGASVALVAGIVKHMDTHTLLALYSSAMLGIPLGMLGNRREVREKAQDIAIHGDRPENKLSRRALVQLLATLAATGALAAWLSTAKP
ncbi:hypothetical protein AB0I49_01080 [Streptomyces sp. NPDC050617]|uniref:hypothetical protein n=1 Tax=Streptomyces sp. NPDC050617 TaxID=3154628 RepID=UPI0034498B51